MSAGVVLDVEKFRKSERRLTPQRQAVLKAFLELSREHPTAESIYQAARRYCPTVGVATVYRSLDLFIQMGQWYGVSWNIQQYLAGSKKKQGGI